MSVSIDDVYNLLLQIQEQIPQAKNEVITVTNKNTSDVASWLSKTLSESLLDDLSGDLQSCVNAANAVAGTNKELQVLYRNLNSVKDNLEGIKSTFSVLSEKLTATSDKLSEVSGDMSSCSVALSESATETQKSLNAVVDQMSLKLTQSTTTFSTNMQNTINSLRLQISDVINSLESSVAEMSATVSGRVVTEIQSPIQLMIDAQTSAVKSLLEQAAGTLTSTAQSVSQALDSLVDANVENEKLEIIANARCEELRSVLQTTTSMASSIRSLNQSYADVVDALNKLRPYVSAQVDIAKQSIEKSATKDTIMAGSAAAVALSSVIGNLVSPALKSSGAKGGKL